MQETHPEASGNSSISTPLKAPMAATPRTDALLAQWNDDDSNKGLLAMAALARQLEQTIAHLSGGPLRISGHQLKQALALAWPDGENDPQQAESVVFLEQLAEGQACHEDTGAGNPPGMYLSFEDIAADEGLYHLGESDDVGTPCGQTHGEDSPRRLDNCEVCRGARGGVFGNENVIGGVIVCDYCHADESYIPKTLEAAYLMGATGAPHNEQERLRYESYMRGHCWQVGVWNADKRHYEDMTNRMLFAVWRDRAAMRG